MGHVIREHENKWNKILTTWIPHRGKRGRGQPPTHWEDEIIKFFGRKWKTKAKNRPIWTDLVAANTQL